MWKGKIGWQGVWNRTKLFLSFLPYTIRACIGWFSLTYIIPTIQVFIIWAIKQNSFTIDKSILNIVLVSNASMFTAIILSGFESNKQKGLLGVASLVAYIFTIVFFVASVIEISLDEVAIFPLDLYTVGAYILLGISLILGLISKYDEAQAISRDISDKGKDKTKTTIGKTDYKL